MKIDTQKYSRHYKGLPENSIEVTRPVLRKSARANQRLAGFGKDHCVFISEVVFEGVSEVKDTYRENQHKVTWSKKERKQKGFFFFFFCLLRGNHKETSWDVLKAEPVVVGPLAFMAKVTPPLEEILGQGPAYRHSAMVHKHGEIEAWVSR